MPLSVLLAFYMATASDRFDLIYFAYVIRICALSLEGERENYFRASRNIR
jgi:hypothetical protein